MFIKYYLYVFFFVFYFLIFAIFFKEKIAWFNSEMLSKDEEIENLEE